MNPGKTKSVWVTRVVAALLLGGFPSLLAAADAALDRADESIFQNTNLLRISIEISEAGIETLRDSRPSRISQVKPEATATVIEGERVYTNVAVQLKGFTSFQPVDRMPGLTLKFDKLAPKQQFHGLTKISLNNSAQDPTRLNEKLARELFAAAGVPVPRADYAVVTLNGRDLGLYVLAEGFDKEFLRRHFTRANGNLYEGGVLQDIDRPLQVTSGKNAESHLAVQKLINASAQANPAERFRALEAILDVDRFLSMVAMETILCHSDSYSMNRNNYRLYHDPATDKITFMPHGMDRVLGTHRSPLDLSIVPPTLGLVARAMLSTPEGRRRYIERAGVLFTNVFDPERLCRRIRELDSRIIEAKIKGPSARRLGGRSDEGRARDADELCARIVQRAAELRMQFAQPSEFLTPASVPSFDLDGVARLGDWSLKRRSGASPVRCEIESANGTLHLRATNGPFAVTLRNRMSLPAGRYRLIGHIDITNAESAPRLVSAALLRHSTSRFDVQRQSWNWRDINFSFQVQESRAPEEIEFICDIRDDSSAVWFDPNAIRLIKE